MKYTKMFLSGVALCAIATAPALAAHAPKLSLVSVKGNVAGGVTGVSHSKTNIVDPKNGINTSTFVTTIAEHYSIGEATYYNVTAYTGGWTWTGTQCNVLPHQKLKVGKAKHGTTGAYTLANAVFSNTTCGTFTGPAYFPTYKLTSKTATSDKMKASLTYKNKKVSKAVLNLPITFTITH